MEDMEGMEHAKDLTGNLSAFDMDYTTYAGPSWRRWPARDDKKILAVKESFGPVIWYMETDTGNLNCHILTDWEYIEIGGNRYTVNDGTDKISAALEREKVVRLLEGM